MTFNIFCIAIFFDVTLVSHKIKTQGTPWKENYELLLKNNKIAGN